MQLGFRIKFSYKTKKAPDFSEAKILNLITFPYRKRLDQALQYKNTLYNCILLLKMKEFELQ